MGTWIIWSSSQRVSNDRSKNYELRNDEVERNHCCMLLDGEIQNDMFGELKLSLRHSDSVIDYVCIEYSYNFHQLFAFPFPSTLSCRSTYIFLLFPIDLAFLAPFLYPPRFPCGLSVILDFFTAIPF